VHDPGAGDPAPAWQSRRGRALFELTLEHSLRPTRHCKPAREDHDRRGGCVYVACVDAQLAGIHRFAFSVGIAARERTSRKPEPNTGAAIGAGAIRTRDITGCSGSVANG